ncbi:MAG: deoxyribonuclease IV [candidate division WOR-3 bacterium]
MKLGFHISIAGGFKNVYKRALQTNCDTAQLFSRNPRSWQYKEIDEEDCALFKKQMEEGKISPLFVHLPYLNNLGSSSDEIFKKSVLSLVEDLKRADKLGAQYLIVHSGSNSDIKMGIKRMIEGIVQALAEVNNGVILLIENTAGSGNEFGYDFKHLHDIISGVSSDRIGVVFDTAHAFAAGYELRTKKGVNETIDILEKTIGIERVHLVHFNDSLAKIGSKKDRHWHIGKGEIGRGMEVIINHPLMRQLPFIMETPRTGPKEDLINMEIARKMISS